jgi:hypothetical protein
MAKWARFCICNRQEMPGSSEQGRALLGLCMTRTLARWYDPEPLGGLWPATILKYSCIHAEGEKGQLGHSWRLKVETDSDPPAVLSTSMCRTTPVAMGCHLQVVWLVYCRPLAAT